MKKYIKPVFIIYCALMLWLLFGQRIGRTDFTDYAIKLRSNINLFFSVEVRRLTIRNKQFPNYLS